MNLTTRARIQVLTQRATALDRALTQQMDEQHSLSQQRPARRWLKRAARLFTAVFALQTALAAGPAFAQVTAAPGAPAGQRPLIDAAANGVPIVHIAPPSAAGVSRNQYQQFNVQGNGLILNNSKGNVQTQLGGWITGNLQMGTTPARIILNEVVGTGASQLRGTIEVAGQRADIVIANPNGISCDGCGFLNTAGRTSLVAGQVRTGIDGVIESFDTGPGAIHVGQAGLNAAEQEHLDLIARGLVIEGEIWARNIHAIAGANKVLYGTLEAAPQGGGAGGPLFAVDIKQLGGMFANQIYLLATEKGLGVNSTGRLAALQGNLVLSAEGDLTVKDAYAKGEVRLASPGRVATTGEIVADANVRIVAPAGFANSGAVQATALSIEAPSISNQGLLVQQSTADFVISAGGGLRNDGTIHARGNLRVDAASVRGTGGQLLAGSDLLVQAQTIDLEQPHLVANGDLQVRADSVRAVGSVVQAGGALRLDSSGRLDVSGSTLSVNRTATLSGTDMSLDQARASIVGDLSVRASAVLSAQRAETTSNGTTELLGARIDASQARLQAQRHLSLQAAGEAALQGAQLISGTSVSIQGQGVSTAFATVSAPTVSVQAGAGTLDNHAGRLLATAPDGALQVAARGIDNRDGEIRSGGALTLQAGAGVVDNAGGTIAGRSGSLSGIGALANQRGMVYTSADLNLSGAGLDNQDGTIASDGSLSITSAGQAIRNSGGTLQAGGSLILDAGGADIASAGGTLSARGTASVRGGTVDLSGSTMAAGQGASIEAAVLQAGGARIAVDGSLQIAVQGDVNLAGASVGAGGNLAVEAANITATGATSAAGGQLQVATGDLRGGTWSAGTHLTATATGAADITGGGFVAGGNVTVQAQGLTTDGGRVAGQNVRLDAGRGAFSNAGGSVIATGSQGNSLQVSGQGIRNTGGTLASAGGAVLNANGQILDNTGGTVQVGGNLQVNASQILNRGGTLATGSSLSLQGQALDNTGGTIMTRGDLSIDTGGRLLDTTGGRLLAQGDASIAAGELRNAGGTIGANGAATVRADKLETSAGRITGARALDVLVTQRLTAHGAFFGSDGAVQLTAHAIEAQAAVLQAGAALNVTAAQSLDITGGTVTALGPQAGPLELQAQSIQANQAIVLGDADVRVRSGGALAADGGRFAAGGTLTLDAQGDLALDAAQAIANGRLQMAGRTVSANSAVLDTAAQLELVARAGSALLDDARLTAGGRLDVQATGIRAGAAEIGAAGNVQLNAGTADFDAADARVRSTAGSVAVSAAGVNAASSQAPASGQQPQTGFIAGQTLSVT
ncbi:MAG: filamentous hemagglutinin N-terminal domain-containing protein, partial [Ramlibacter sp.]